MISARDVTRMAVVGTMVVLLGTNFAHAGDTHWNAGTGNWSNGSNWSDGEPTSVDGAYINNGGTAQITAPNKEVCSGLYLGEGSTDSGTVDMTGGTLSLPVNSNIFVGVNGHGTLNITEGGAISNYAGLIGCEYGSKGKVTVDGSGSIWSNQYALWVGYEGNGTLDITAGGEVRNSTASNVGNDPGSTGVVTVKGAGSKWTASGESNVGFEGDGTLNITGGGAVSNDTGYIGRRSGSTGAVTVDGLGSTWANDGDVHVGFEGNGTLNITGGAVVTNEFGFIGLGSGVSGAVTVDGTGSKWINCYAPYDSRLRVGERGHGTLNISGGGAVISDSCTIGFSSGSTGVVTVDGTGSTWTNNLNLYVSYSGDGTLNIIGGGLVSVGDTLTIDEDGDGDGFINMSTGGMLALFGDADDSLGDFLNLVDGTDAIRYWNDDISGWDRLTNATLGVDYQLAYLTAGDLAGYTLLTVPEPATLGLLAFGGLAMTRRRKKN
ncbi:MAG: PEP-CTERM sorting domain-containing protein [Planctomycetota bacterium]|nr:PEP-CTERM sorting domain-containing protein [Planctomycetota bacterium]